ncbi:MAG: hypothetical protein R2795_13435 [Saprospiraceae bacterium]
METLDLIQEIQKLPLVKKILVIEEIVKSIKREEIKYQMESAVRELYADYINDEELTAFTSLDFEHFYETKVKFG